MEEKDYILFEDYLNGTLSVNDKKAFDERLKVEAEFNESFLNYKELSGFLENKFENEQSFQAFEENLKNIADKHFNKKEEKSKVIKFKPWQYAIAASIAILFGVFMFNTNSNPSYNDFSNHNSISLTVRGENDVLLSNAEKAFNEKDFEQAKLYFTQILKEDDSNDEIKLYKAISLIETNQFSEAEDLLKEVLKGTSVFRQKALWYMALSKLKQKDYDACKSTLGLISEDAEEYDQAKKLLREL